MRASIVNGAVGALVLAIAISCDSGMPTNPRDLPIIGSPQSIEIAPTSATLVVGSQQQISIVSGSATGVTWQSADPSVVTVGNDGMVSARSSGTGRIIAKGGGRPDTAFITVRNAAASLSLTPDSLTLSLGDSSALQLAVLDSKGAPLASTAPATVDWTSQDPTVATVSSTGLVKTIGLGRTTIIVSLDGKLTWADVQVVARSVASITMVSPSSMNLSSGSTYPLQVLLKDANGDTLTGRTISWTTSNASVAAVSAGGVVTAVSAGTATITAQASGKTASTTITVTPAAVASVAVTFAAPSVSVGGTTQATATARDAAGNVLTGLPVTWSSANTNLATVSSTGVVTGVAGGSVLIVATVNGLGAGGVFTVTSGTNTGTGTVATVSIVLSPATVMVGQGGTATAVAKDASGNLVTGRPVVWQTNDSRIASVATNGAITASMIGIVTLKATVDGITASTPLAVTGTQLGSVRSVQITLSPASFNAGQTSQATATARDSAGNIITGRPVTWRFGNTDIATISSTGLMTATAAGVGGLTAIVDGYPGELDVTIGAATVSPVASVSVALSSSSITVGQTSQATATARDASGNAVTGSAVTWSSSNTAAATVDQTGLVSGVAAGTASIIATVSGNVVGSSTVTVATAPSNGPASVSVSASTTTVNVGATSQLTATVKNSAGQAISGATVTWSTSNASVASVSSTGLVTGNASGSAIIAASSGSVSGTITITVSGSAAPPPPPPVTPANIVPPTLPTLFTTTAYVPPTRVVAVPAGTDLQAALNAAQPGDELVLDAGATYTGNFVLPAKSGASASAWITITSAALSQLPGEGTRMNPSYAALLPKIVSPNATPAIATLPQASYYRIMGVEITEAPGQTLNYGLVTLGDGSGAQNSLSMIPHHLILDRVYVHGNSVLNLSRCVGFNSAWSAVIDSYLSECHAQGSDSQAIGGWNGPGPFKIVDNYLEAAGENILFGGADPAIVGMNPSDIEVRHNHIIKPPAWRGVWTAKNLFECKDARRVLLEGNVLENSWPDGQTGHAILLQALTDGNTAPWTTVQDITIRYNWIKNAAGGATVDSRVAYNTGGTTPVMPTQPSQRISFQNNVFENIGNDPAGGAQYLFALFNDLQNVSLLHNTGAGTKALVEFDGNPQTGLVIQDNVVGKGDYGFFGSGEGEGNGALAFYAPGALIQRNVIFGNTGTGPVNPSIYPANNSFPATAAAVGFMNWSMTSVSVTDFGLTGVSPFKGTASDGTNPGADVATIQSLLVGVVQP